MNREQRRAQKKREAKKPAWKKLTKDEIAERLTQNGITPKDVKQEWDRGYQAGFRDAGKPVMEMTFACFCLALKELYGFGEKRCFDVLTKTHERMQEYITGHDAAKDVLEKIGLTLDWDDPFETVKEI